MQTSYRCQSTSLMAMSRLPPATEVYSQMVLSSSIKLRLSLLPTNPDLPLLHFTSPSHHDPDVLHRWSRIQVKVCLGIRFAQPREMTVLRPSTTRLKRPFRPPKATLKEIHDAVPKHLLQRARFSEPHLHLINRTIPQPNLYEHCFTLCEISRLLPFFSGLLLQSVTGKVSTTTD